MSDLLEKYRLEEEEASRRVTLEKRPKPQYGYRNMYAVLIDGVHRGHIAMRNGWGGRWDFLTVRQMKPGILSPYIGSKDNAPRNILVDFNRKPDADYWRSEEDYADAEAKKVADRQANEKRWAEDAKAREAQRIETLEGLRSIRDNHGSMLSNFERSALVHAITKFGSDS